jgi:hypothetical protein
LTMKRGAPTLCFPDGDKTCFACCPPIRPAGYDHADYEGMIKRVLRENTRSFRAGDKGRKSITGFSCWALGYLDAGCRLVGCLLHPARNRGADLRFRVGFGEKCRRETCPEARVFDLLPGHARAFWLEITRGLDSFAYSSRKRNPLFHFLNWGPDILVMIAEQDPTAAHSPSTMAKAFPVLGSRLPPRASAYAVGKLAALLGPDVFRDPDLVRLTEEKWLPGLVSEIQGQGPFGDAHGTPPVHRLPMDRRFLDFLRLSAGILRVPPEKARELKGLADRNLEKFAREIRPGRRPGKTPGRGETNSSLP